MNPHLSHGNVTEALEASNNITELAEYLGVSRQALYASKYPWIQEALEALRQKDELDAFIGLRLERTMKRWLEQQAAEDGVSVGQFIREWLMGHPGYAAFMSQFD